MKKILIFLALAAFAASCSSFQRQDDAVRIKPDKAEKYDILFDTDSSVIGTRNGNTLRGTVIGILKKTYANDCPADEFTKYTTRDYVLFLDSLSEDVENIEQIPLEDVELIGTKLPDLPENDYGNINWFENFNNPLDPRNIREVRVDSVYIDTCSVDYCDCAPLSVNVRYPELNLRLECPDCDYSWYFLELRGGYAVYDDVNPDKLTIGRDGYLGEAAFGARFGRYGLGLAVSSGVPIYNSLTEGDIYRPVTMLHGRYHFDKIACMIPFAYGQFGMSIDEFSLDLFKVSVCDGCKSNIEVEPPNADISIPVSWGFGIGLDIPNYTCLFDLSFDLGFRSLAVGQPMVFGGFANLPTKRRINMLVLRMGITFGY